MNRRLLSLLFISILQLTLLNFGVEAPFPRIHRKLANKPGDPDRYAVFLKPLITIAPRKIIKKIHDARDRLLQRLAEGDRSDNLIQWSRLKSSDDEGEFSADSEIARRPSSRAESMPDLSELSADSEDELPQPSKAESAPDLSEFSTDSEKEFPQLYRTDSVQDLPEYSAFKPPPKPPRAKALPKLTETSAYPLKTRSKSVSEVEEVLPDSEIPSRITSRSKSLPELINYRFTLRHSSRDPVTADKGSKLLVEVDGQDIKEEVDLSVLYRIPRMSWLRTTLKTLLLKKRPNLNDGISINGAGLCLKSERDSTYVALDTFFWINYKEATIIVYFVDEKEKSISSLLYVYPILYVAGDELKLIVFSNTLEYLGHTTVSKSYDSDSVNRPRKKQYLAWLKKKLKRGDKKAIVFDH